MTNVTLRLGQKIKMYKCLALVQLSIVLCMGAVLCLETSSRRTPDKSYTECYDDGNCAQISEWENTYSWDDSNDYPASNNYNSWSSSVDANSNWNSNTNTNVNTNTNTNTNSNSYNYNYYNSNNNAANWQDDSGDELPSKGKWGGEKDERVASASRGRQGGASGSNGFGFSGDVDFGFDGLANLGGAGGSGGSLGDMLRAPADIATGVMNTFTGGLLGGSSGRLNSASSASGNARGGASGRAGFSFGS